MTTSRESSPSVLVVVVNYRSAGLTIDCLDSLAAEVAAWPRARVVVVDNASGDDSMDRLRATVAERGWTRWVSLLPSPSNGGFAAGNNLAIVSALAGQNAPDFLWLLNPDTLIHRGALSELASFLQSSPEVGLVGSRIEGADGELHPSAFRFPSVRGEIENGFRLGLLSRLLERWVVAPAPPIEARRVDWVSGASLMVRREVFETIGCLDEGYFMYYEEVDFCRRAALAGWTCWYVPTSRVVHLVGGASESGPGRAHRRRMPAYWFASRRRYFLTHKGKARTFLADLGWASGFLTFRLRQRLQKKADTDPPRFLRDFVSRNVRLWFRGEERGHSRMALS